MLLQCEVRPGKVGVCVLPLKVLENTVIIQVIESYSKWLGIEITLLLIP